MIGDRMDTDVIAGIEARLATIVVLSGVTTREETERNPLPRSRIVDSVAKLIDTLN
jgi:NagD protein